MRCVTRRSNSAVVSVCWPVMVSSIGSIVTTRLGCFGSGLASFDSRRARNTGSLPVCATRLSVASARAFSKVWLEGRRRRAGPPGRGQRGGGLPPCAARGAVISFRLKKSVSAG